MSKSLRVLLLYGGKSGEHEISLRSAASVLHHLDPARYEIIPIGMDHAGRFYVNDREALMSYVDELPVQAPGAYEIPSLLEQGRIVLNADVVFPVVHGPLYEDGCFQGLLSLAGVAYVGCDVLSSAIGMDKDLSRRIACGDDLLSARYRVLSWHASLAEQQAFCEQTAHDLGWPLFVKPCSMGSSVGIHKVHHHEELMEAILDAKRFDKTVIVEEFIQGREIELAVLEHENPAHAPHVSCPGEIRVRHTDGFYSYTAKYLESQDTDLIIPAVLDANLIARLQQAAADIFMRLKCGGMARVDFFVQEETQAIYFNEINTLPGFTSISMYPKLWAYSGVSYPALLDRLIALAITHQRCREQLVTQYQ